MTGAVDSRMTMKLTAGQAAMYGNLTVEAGLLRATKRRRRMVCAYARVRACKPCTFKTSC